MFGKSRRVSNGADGESSWLVQHVQGALITRSDSWKNDARLTLEPFELMSV